MILLWIREIAGLKSLTDWEGSQHKFDEWGEIEMMEIYCFIIMYK